MDLAELWLQIDSYLQDTDFTERTEANARRVHDALMLLLCFREHPITRPTCMRILQVPGEPQPCSLCTTPGCLGNSWTGSTAVFRHYKTSGTYGNHTITVLPGSKTELVLQHYTGWGRALLLKDPSSNALFLTRYGKPFIRDGCFNKYLPRLLQSVSGAKLSWTKARTCSSCCMHPLALTHVRCTLPQLRHITANGLVPLASAEQLEGLAACMQTRCAPRRAQRGAPRASRMLTRRSSARKLTTVYQDNRREYVAHLGLELYQSAGGAAAGAGGHESEEESEDETAFQTATTPARAAPPAAQQLQLALVPQPGALASPAAAPRGERAPVAHLLSLVPARRPRIGTLLQAYANNLTLH